MFLLLKTFRLPLSSIGGRGGGKIHRCCCCCCSHVSIVACGHGEFEVLLTPTERVKVHAPQKFLQLSVDPHTSWNLLNYYLTLAIEYWQVCTLCH